MAILTKEQRNQLSKVVLEARGVAEAAAKKALRSLGVEEADAPSHLSLENKTLRRALRAQARQLGDREDPRKKGSYDLYHLREKIAYDQWHRMLFARFLAENDLLISPDHGVAVSLAECRELAPEIGLKDEWEVAVQFAAQILPQIFRPDDPVAKIDLAPEDRSALRDLVISLPRDVFLADDSLGWVYQFWQAKQKDEVNKSEKKIGADEIAPVTQLFTEHYMVQFLLHNTLGAWWFSKRKAEGKDPSLNGIEFTYLRLKEDGMPAAGTFSDWPKHAKDVRVLDPCMGSGHFLVTELPILVAMRMEDEALSKADACDAVLRDNLFGLEIDARCTQIAAFNLALAAWKFVGYRQLPSLNLACSGLGINARKEEWLKLANGEDRLRRGMEQIYDLFQQAPVLGSLINPKRIGGNLVVAHFHELQPLLEKALARETAKNDENLSELGVTARGLAHAGEILASQFTLVATNVPYLGRGKQHDVLKDYCERFHPEGKADLSTSFLERCLEFCALDGAAALVTPQNWLFLATYRRLRELLLREKRWELVVRLGPNAFQDMNWWAATTALVVISSDLAQSEHKVQGMDVSSHKQQSDKAILLRGGSVSGVFSPLESAHQKDLLENADARIVLRDSGNAELLSKFVSSNTGFQTGDNDRYSFLFWELPQMTDRWEFFHRTSQETCMYGGRIRILRWEDGKGALAHEPGCVPRGLDCRGKRGVLVHRMNELPATLFSGEMFDQNGAAIIPHNDAYLSAIWCFLASEDYRKAVRLIDTKTGVTPATLMQIPFDLKYWRQVASDQLPNGLPRPASDDPTQWLFNGHPRGAEQSLQIAVARLLGYNWPRQTGSSFPDCPALRKDGLDRFGDDDGIVCVNRIKGEQPAADRLRALLTAAFENEWSPGKQNVLLEQTGYGGKTLEDWLRNGFFEQHCHLFHQRPFIWQIWDGRRDGFSALVNYHKLNRSNLEKLTYTFLGDWIARQRAAKDAGEEGSDARLQAAVELQQKLKLILEGEGYPEKNFGYDIFVRWKPLGKQPIGWEPDLNDGVRLNIRPFVQAGVLRKDPKINWNKDRGKDVGSAPWYNKYDLRRVPDYKPGDRINDYHLTLEEKSKARKQA